MLDGIAVITDNVNMTTDIENSQWYDSKAWPTLIATNDYYPFGLAMSGRTSQLAETNAYRYGFNGKELDNFGELSQLEIETVDLSTALVFEMAINATLQTSNTNLIVTNTGGAYVTDRNGANDGAFKLNGTNDYIKVNDTPELEVGASDFTIGGWVKKNANTSGSDNSMFVTKWNTGASPGTNSWILSVGKKSVGNVVRFYYEEGTDKYEFVSTLKLNANEWYHVVARRTGSLLEVLVNSEVWISEDIGAAQFNDVNIPMYIGALGGALSSTYNSNITVDDIRLFKRAIRTSELNAWQNGANESTLNNPSNNAAALASNNHYDYGFRIYNPRIAKFLSVDPLSPDYPELTPYQFASNTPIWAVDIDGLEAGYTVSYNVYVDKNGNYVTDQIHDPVLTTTNGDWSGIRMDNQFFHNDVFMGNSQGNVPGWNDWERTQQEEFNKGVAAFGLGAVSVLLAIPSGGTSLGMLAIGTGATSMGLGGFKFFQASEGKVEEYKNLPLGLGEAAGGFIGAQFGDEELGKKIGGFGESLLTGKGAIKDLPKALMNKDALNVAQGIQGLYELGTKGYEAYGAVTDRIQTQLDQQTEKTTTDD